MRHTGSASVRRRNQLSLQTSQQNVYYVRRLNRLSEFVVVQTLLYTLTVHVVPNDESGPSNVALPCI